MSAAERRELIEATATRLFAERGYKGASVEEIARRSGVTPPVVYDHFDSKLDLYRGLLERRFTELREVWREGLGTDGTAAERTGGSVAAWFAYVESNPDVARMLFRQGEGDPAAEAAHAEVAAHSSAAVMSLFAAEPGAENVAGALDRAGIEMAWVVFRGILQGLALWWVDHPEVPRERVVTTAMNALWLGLERVSGGETWAPEPGGGPLAAERDAQE